MKVLIYNIVIKIAKYILTFTNFVLFTIVILLIIFTERSNIYYSILEKHTQEDMDFIIKYHNYNNTTCIAKEYRTHAEYLDKFIHELKAQPSLLFHKSIVFTSSFNHMHNEDIVRIMKLFSQSKCFRHINLNNMVLSPPKVHKIRNLKTPNIETITILRYNDLSKQVPNAKGFQCSNNIKAITNTQGENLIIISK